jgi:hypothetical protein
MVIPGPNEAATTFSLFLFASDLSLSSRIKTVGLDEFPLVR